MMVPCAKNFPQYKEIKNLESISQKEGSGISFEDLLLNSQRKKAKVVLFLLRKLCHKK